MIQLRLARDDDEADMRALLRQHGMPSGGVSFTMEREPHWNAGQQVWGTDELALVARDEQRLAGMFTLVNQQIFANGQPLAATYLGALRIPDDFRNQARVLRAGFAAARRHAPSPLWFTSIAHDNRVARRLLERGLPGFPRYRAVGDLCTLLLGRRAARAHAADLWQAADPEEWAHVFNRLALSHHFAPQMTAELLARLPAGALQLARRPGGPPLACAAWWDQRAARQIVARAYASWLARARPVLNAWWRCAGGVELPAPGQPLAACFLAFLRVAPGLPDGGVELVRRLLSRAPTPAVLLGLPAGSLLQRRLAPLSSSCLRTRLYTVDHGTPWRLDARAPWPEAALC